MPDIQLKRVHVNTYTSAHFLTLITVPTFSGGATLISWYGNT